MGCGSAEKVLSPIEIGILAELVFKVKVRGAHGFRTFGEKNFFRMTLEHFMQRLFRND